MKQCCRCNKKIVNREAQKVDNKIDKLNSVDFEYVISVLESYGSESYLCQNCFKVVLVEMKKVH